MSEHPVDPKLKEMLSLLLEIAVGNYEKLPTTAADQLAERFIRKHRLVSLAPGQIVIDGEPAGWMNANGPLAESSGMVCSLSREQASPDDIPVYFGPVREADDE